MANILAYFPSEDDAEDAAAKLRSLGYEDLGITKVTEYLGDSTDRRFNPMTGRISSLAKLTLGADFSAEGDDVGPLLAADPSASGLADTHEGQGANYLLTVVIADELWVSAREIIKQYGGMA
ncbi:MAG: hypothetical protein M1379_01850 [Firmicutes bacterium]|nr:hypothetical protein [Bacillota bacterium]